MDTVTLSIPRMWADHHVLEVRQVLADLGVAECEISAALSAVRLSYDPTVIERDAILSALSAAGYPSSDAASFPEPLANKEAGSAWFVQGLRVTQTNRLDLEMSGDFRKY